jgi:sodium/potassium-transporting ATPase subunit alpha
MITMNVVVVLVWYGPYLSYMGLDANRGRATWLRKSHPDFINVPTLIVSCVSVAVAFIPDGLPIAVTARYLRSTWNG